MTSQDDDRTIDPDRTFDPLTSAPTLAAATPTPTPATARFAPGAIIGGRYRLVSLLGRGAEQHAAPRRRIQWHRYSCGIPSTWTPVSTP